MRRAFPLAVAAVLLFVPSTFALDWGWGGDRVKEEKAFERTVAVRSDVTIRTETTNGNIDIVTGTGDEVSIQADIEAQAKDRATALELLDETEVRVEESGDRLVIEAVTPRGSWRRGSVSVSFRLTVPEGASVDVRSTNGGVDVDGVGGTVRAETTNGNIRLEAIGGDAVIETTNGSIKAFGVDGALDASTTNGGIDAEVVAEYLGSDMSLSTTNGAIDLELAAGVSASIDARAGNGRVTNDLSGGSVSRDKRDHVVVDLGRGGPEIRVRTTNGRIRLRDAR